MSKMPQIPGYRLIKKLGQGGMADVYLGVQEKLQRHVAVKVMVPSLFRDDQFSRRFIKEAQTAAQLSHPNIITIHDVGEADSSYYIVMEYLEETLSNRLDQKKCLVPREALEIVKMIASALDYAHKKGFIHRDIKPDNIMFRSDGTVVLVDFGIARAMDSSTHLTRTGMSIGTPHYMSPEQCKGEKIDGRSDIYSLGVQLYEMLTGKVPYEAENTAGIIIKQIQDPVPRLPDALSRYQFLIDKMMAKDQKERIQSGEELIRFIEGVITAQVQKFMPPPVNIKEETVVLEEPTAQTPVSPYIKPRATRMENGDRKKRLFLGAAAVVLVVLVATFIILFFPKSGKNNGLESSTKDDAKIQQPVEKENKTEDKQKIDQSGETSENPVNKNTDNTVKGDDTKNRENVTENPPNGTETLNSKEGSQEKDKTPKPSVESGFKQKDRTKKEPSAHIKKTPPKVSGKKVEERAKPRTEVKTVSILGLSSELQRKNALKVQRIQIPVFRKRFQVKGQITLELLINEHGKVTILSYQDMMTIIPALRERQVKGLIKNRFDNFIFPKPKDDRGRPVKFKWRLTFKVGKYLDKIILTRQ